MVDIVVAFPFYVLIIALVFVLGPGERSIYIAITAVGWVSYARIIRGEILVAKRQEYVLAAQSGGLSNLRIMGRHLLPNVITQAIIYAMSDIVQDILAIVTLSYLGLGIQPPTPDWGTMISDGQNFLTTHWQLTTIPGLAVVVTGLGAVADRRRPRRPAAAGPVMSGTTPVRQSRARGQRPARARSPPGAAWSARWTASRSRCRAARRSAWSASPARARA